jgi:hypothetical protein
MPGMEVVYVRLCVTSYLFPYPWTYSLKNVTWNLSLKVVALFPFSSVWFSLCIRLITGRFHIYAVILKFYMGTCTGFHLIILILKNPNKTQRWWFCLLRNGIHPLQSSFFQSHVLFPTSNLTDKRLAHFRNISEIKAKWNRTQAADCRVQLWDFNHYSPEGELSVSLGGCFVTFLTFSQNGVPSSFADVRSQNPTWYVLIHIHQAFNPIGTWCSSAPGLKRSWREANYWAPSSAEVKNVGAIPPLPLSLHGIALK